MFVKPRNEKVVNENDEDEIVEIRETQNAKISLCKKMA